jgi:hypothetical protein
MAHSCISNHPAAPRKLTNTTYHRNHAQHSVLVSITIVYYHYIMASMASVLDGLDDDQLWVLEEYQEYTLLEDAEAVGALASAN